MLTTRESRGRGLEVRGGEEGGGCALQDVPRADLSTSARAVSGKSGSAGSGNPFAPPPPGDFCHTPYATCPNPYARRATRDAVHACGVRFSWMLRGAAASSLHAADLGSRARFRQTAARQEIVMPPPIGIVCALTQLRSARADLLLPHRALAPRQGPLFALSLSFVADGRWIHISERWVARCHHAAAAAVVSSHCILARCLSLPWTVILVACRCGTEYDDQYYYYILTLRYI